MDYKELDKLVESLNACAGEADCEKCKHVDDGDQCFEGLASEAAEAITELRDSRNLWMKMYISALQHECNTNEWISVDDALPQEKDRYIVCQDIFGIIQNVTVAVFTKNLRKVDKKAFRGKEYKRPGWYTYSGSEVPFEMQDITHWMPLPNPPEIEDEHI